MAKSKSEINKQEVPPHIFEFLLRGTLANDGDVQHYKDELMNWYYNPDQLAQIINALKKGDAGKVIGKEKQEIIKFIETKFK